MLAAGYRVRGSVRSKAKAEHLKSLIPQHRQQEQQALELVEADLLDEQAWAKAVIGCDYVMHTASPFPSKAPDHEDELIKPAVQGTLAVLRAIVANPQRTIKRVVLTSSVASIQGGHESHKTHFTNQDWTNTSTDAPSHVEAYSKSKTLAEKAAWDYLQSLTEEQKFELAVINPGFVIGPTLSQNPCTSAEVFVKLLSRAYPALPNLIFSCVDVRDVARAHILAMTNEQAAGKRFIVAPHVLPMPEIGSVLAGEFDPFGYNVPTTKLPYALLWVASFFDAQLKFILPGVGVAKSFDNTPAEQILGLKWHDKNDSIKATGYSVIAQGLVPARNDKLKVAPAVEVDLDGIKL